MVSALDAFILSSGCRWRVAVLKPDQYLAIYASANLVSIAYQRDDRMSFVDKFVAEILALQVALYHSRARLEARTDSEALHDLRIAVRRIRSLLRPMRAMSEVVALNIAAAEVGRNNHTHSRSGGDDSRTGE